MLMPLTKSGENCFETAGGLNDFALGHSAAISAGEREPGAHPHLSSDQLTMQQRPLSEPSPIYASSERAFHRKDSIKGGGVDCARCWYCGKCGLRSSCRSPDTSNLIEAFAKCRGKVLKRAQSGYVESLQTRPVEDG